MRHILTQVLYVILFSLISLLFTIFIYILREAFVSHTLPEVFIFNTKLPKQDAGCTSLEFNYQYYKDAIGNDNNNIYGIYVYAEDTEFLDLAAELVNSNGGDWGYVLIPFNISTDRDFEKWRKVFEVLAEKHLIPIIQLNALDLDEIPRDTKRGAEFLNFFDWPVKDRYISVYNEPNDSNFWYGKADPKQYAEILDTTIDIFKDINSNYFMLNGALNISASGGNGTIDALDFINQMYSSRPEVFNKLDGWASHSYPQPNFSGSPYGSGRNSVRAYEFELSYLSSVLGISKEYPIFITETGWAHAEGLSYNPSYYTSKRVGENFKIAYEQVWLKDKRIKAVIPFTIWYPPPFDHFAWVDVDKEPFEQFFEVKSMKKVAGTPETLFTGRIESNDCN
ncbi:MAG TPA: hypothetical protein PLF29_00905 [bacterium]|nr:hypothetical protein [bacterium]